MNTKKQQCIKDAYLKLISEEEFNKLDPDSDGWLFSSELLLLSVSGTVLDFKEGKQLMARPKSLAGIETNNNWIELKGILNEITHEGDIFIINKSGEIEINLNGEYLELGYATHYQPIILPSKPLY